MEEEDQPRVNRSEEHPEDQKRKRNPGNQADKIAYLIPWG